ncbi:MULTISPECIES: hypothetical protein [Streptomyces]|uniref:FxLD family lantipeptide n=1 Tax=Streptomyces tubbatahanensis TaxID=2923272 RepID=A0ABY3XYZ3_9ACTN|nr:MULTISPECIES: hypothetical protein [Streptomyces]UNS99625.1 hypothetical protein MMF93_26620 [Streptomyces tubbatahanensis]
METLSEFTPREAGALPAEPQTSFADTDMSTAAADRCPISMCVDHCVGTQTG